MRSPVPQKERNYLLLQLHWLDDCHLFEATDHVLGDSEFFKCIQHGLLSITVRPIARGNAPQSGKRHSLERIELTAAD
jgi:hypothetical protein